MQSRDPNSSPCRNLEEYESNVLYQTLPQFYTIRNLEIFASVIIAMNPRKIED